jgi:ankyrin repeat protein
MDPLTPRSPYNQPIVGQISTLAPGLVAHPVTARSTSNTFAGHSPAPFSNSPAFYEPTYSFTGQSPGPFWTLPGIPQSPSSPWNLFREVGEFENTNAPGFEYNPETYKTKLNKLVQLIKDSEEIGNIDYTQTMLEVNSLVYDLVTEDEPKFDALFKEALDKSHPTCYICSGLRKIGNDQMAQKVESERLLLEAIAVSMGRFGEDHNTTLHFRYNLLVLYQDWSCRVENTPALLAQIVEVALRRTLAGTNSLPLLHLINSKGCGELVYSCRFHVAENYPTWLGCLFSMLQGLSIPSDEEGRNIEENLWNISKGFCIWYSFEDRMESTVPLLDLILRLDFTISNALRSVHFWTAVFLLAIGQYWEPIFNSRHIISNAITQTSLSCTITLNASLDQSAIIPSQQADPELSFELAMALVEVSLEEIEIIGDSGTVGSTSELTEWLTIMEVLEHAAKNGNSRVITLLTKHFKDCEFQWGNKWEHVLNHDGQISEYYLESDNAPLCLAAKAGCEPAVRALIDAGAYVDGPREADTTPLELAVESSHHSIVRLLIEEGARGGYVGMVYVMDSSDRKLQNLWMERIFFEDDWFCIFGAAVHIAETEKYDLYDMLYEKIRSKLEEREDKCDSKHGLSLLEAKIEKFSSELDDILRQCIDDISGRGLELILNSLTGRHVEQQVRSILGKVFLELTRSPQRELPKKDESSRLPILHLLVSRNAPNALSVFLDLGADTKVTDDQDNTALHIAASRNRIACARQLLQHGIEVEAGNALGQTALQVADQHEYRAFMELVSTYVGGDD